MKLAPLVLVASLAANAALAAFLFLRSPASAPAPATSTAAAARPANASGDKALAALQAALASGDAAALEAAGLSPELARDIAVARPFARFANRVRALQARAGADDPRWWRRRSSPTKSREEELQIQRELSEALRGAFGEDFGWSGDDAFAFLPAAKRAKLSQIKQDYAEMEAKFSGDGYVQLASDKEKLRLLRAERDRDIAALLSPGELAEYEMRTSTAGSRLASLYGDAIETEDDFRKLFALQKAFDDKFPREALQGRISPETLRARADAEKQLQADMRAARGEGKYAALRRAADTDLGVVEALAKRLNLPAATTDHVAASRDGYAAESQRINADTSLSIPQRRAQITELANRAKTDLVHALGAEAADAYAQRSQWLSLMQNGTAFSTAPTAGSPGALGFGGQQSVFPVLPAGVNAGNVRQVVNVVGAPPPAGGGGPGENVRVMSFSTVESPTTPAQPSAGTPAAAAR